MSRKTTWKALSSTHVINSPYLVIRDERVELPNGEIVEHYYINECPGWTCIFCLTESGKVVLNRQYKHGIGLEVLELPAGTMKEGEKPEECARRELLEETGYSADHFEHVRTFIIDPTGSSGMMHLFFCRDARLSGKKQADPSEEVINETVDMDTLIQLLASGEISVMGHVAAIYTILVREGILSVA